MFWQGCGQHSFKADPDPAVFLNADPDTDPDATLALQNSGVSLNFVTKKLIQFAVTPPPPRISAPIFN